MHARVHPGAAARPGGVWRNGYGHEYDDEIGLINMGGRIYDPDLRRFLTPDPFVSGPFNARGLDRYGYVDGDPANRMDPTGFSAEPATSGGSDPGAAPCDGGCGVNFTTGDSPGAGANPGGQNLDPSAGVAAGGDEADPNTGQGDKGGQYIDDDFSNVLRGLETAQNVALGTAGVALAIAAILPAVEAAVVSAAANMGAATVGTGGAAAATRSYGSMALKFGKGLWNTGVKMGSRGAARLGRQVSGWARSWSGTFQRLAGDERGALFPAGGARVVRIGNVGERAVRAVHDIGPKVKIAVNGRTRIPDGLTAKVLSEVKNVKYQHFSTQLRDFAEYARDNGLRFDLYVRPTTGLSTQLLEARASGLVNILEIPLK